MKILHILQCANLGGMERAVLETMTALQQLGHRNRLVSLNPIGGLGTLLEERGVEAVGLKYGGPAGMWSLGAMRKAFRRADLDAVIMSGHNFAGFAALAGIGCERRLLNIHYHHTGVKPEWQWKLIYVAAMRVFSRIAFCTDFVRREAEEIHPPLKSVSATFRNPFPLRTEPTDAERRDARRALGIPDGTRVVGNAGWMIARKRWDVFLKASQEISRSHKDVLFVACGDGPLRAEMEDLGRRLGIERQLRWLGWQKDLTTFYLSLDVLLFNSDWDALGRTPVEAGAFGVPTVASVRRGGLREVIQSEEFGFLSDDHDEAWLARKTLALLEDGALRSRIGGAFREMLRRRHDPLDCAASMLELLGMGGSSAGWSRR